MDQRYNVLIQEINFPITYVDSSPYGKEVKAYLTGEWDGSEISGDDWAGYNAVRYVTSRTYYWIASNLINGKSYSLSANVDYNGYKDVIPGRTKTRITVWQ